MIFHVVLFSGRVFFLPRFLSCLTLLLATIVVAKIDFIDSDILPLPVFRSTLFSVVDEMALPPRRRNPFFFSLSRSLLFPAAIRFYARVTAYRLIVFPSLPRLSPFAIIASLLLGLPLHAILPFFPRRWCALLARDICDFSFCSSVGAPHIRLFDGIFSPFGIFFFFSSSCFCELFRNRPLLCPGTIHRQVLSISFSFLCCCFSSLSNLSGPFPFQRFLSPLAPFAPKRCRKSIDRTNGDSCAGPKIPPTNSGSFLSARPIFFSLGLCRAVAWKSAVWHVSSRSFVRNPFLDIDYSSFCSRKPSFLFSSRSTSPSLAKFVTPSSGPPPVRKKRPPL